MTFDVARSRSIDELYGALKGVDRIVTKDPALADALNVRVDVPRLETFASTPRGLVYRREVEDDLRDRRELFLAINHRTELSWKETYHYLDQALTAWEETGELEALEQFDRFRTPEARTVLDHLGRLDSVFRAMEDYEPAGEGSVAVVAPEKLTALDRHVLPEAYEEVSFLVEDSASPEPFRVFPSVTSLVRAVTDNVTRENARDVAVVVDPDAPYQPLLEAEFRRRDINFMRDETLTDHEDFRVLFTLMRAAFTREGLRVRDVLPLVHRFDARIPLEHHDSFFESYDHEALEPFRHLFSSVVDSTFSEVVDRYEEVTDVELDEFHEVLDGMNYADRTVTPSHLNDLEFYLRNFDVKVDENRSGVLFASPTRTAYVDRDLVFYLGMDSSWTRNIPDYPWVDHDRHRSVNIRDFQVMLQNGQRQYYLVQEHYENEDVTPCFYFNVLSEDSFETFSDADHETMSGLPDLEMGSGFEHDPDPVEPEDPPAFSQSGLNTFVRSPRDYLFDRLVPTVENVYMRKGQVFHDFAEFYVNDPERAREVDAERFVDLMEDAVAPLADEWDRASMRTEFRVGVENISRFIEQRGLDAFDPRGYEPNQFDRENPIARAFDLDGVGNPLSEAWFEDRGLGLHGLVDFLASTDEIVDFKSGNPRSKNKVVEQASPDRFVDDPDFQVILYLAYHRRQYPDETIQFTFFHFLENVAERLRDEGDLEDTLVTVRYFPRSFAEEVPRKRTYEYLLTTSKKRRKTLEGAGYDAYRSFFANQGFPDFEDRDEAESSDFSERYAAHNRNHFKDAKYVTKQSKKTVRKLVGFRRRNFFEEDVDRFESFLDDQLEHLEACRASEFPVENGVEDLDLDQLHHRDLIVDDRHE